MEAGCPGAGQTCKEEGCVQRHPVSDWCQLSVLLQAHIKRIKSDKTNSDYRRKNHTHCVWEICFCLTTLCCRIPVMSSEQLVFITVLHVMKHLVRLIKRSTYIEACDYKTTTMEWYAFWSPVVNIPSCQNVSRPHLWSSWCGLPGVWGREGPGEAAGRWKNTWGRAKTAYSDKQKDRQVPSHSSHRTWHVSQWC